MSTELTNSGGEIVEAPNLRNDPTAFLTDATAFNHLWRVAMGYSRSKLIPIAFQAKPDDCFIICQLAIRMRVDPFMLMQSCYVVHGRPGFEAKLAIALLNSSGKIRGTLKTSFSGEGDDYGCQAVAIDAATGDRILGPRITWKIVRAERWDSKEGSKWKSMPEMMFIYRAASWFIRSNYPEVLMGMQTLEEVDDISTNQAPARLTNQSRLETLISSAGTPDGPAPIDTAAVAVEEGKPEPGNGEKPLPTDAEREDIYTDLWAAYQERIGMVSDQIEAEALVNQAAADPEVLALPGVGKRAIINACNACRVRLQKAKVK